MVIKKIAPEAGADLGFSRGGGLSKNFQKF